MNKKAMSAQGQPSFPAIQIQSCDGVTMVLCQELGVVSWNADKNLAKRRVEDALVANARVALRKSPEQLETEEERLMQSLAPKILENQGNLWSMFPINDLDVPKSVQAR